MPNHWRTTALIAVTSFTVIIAGCAILILFQNRSCGSLSDGHGLGYVYVYGPMLVLASGLALFATAFLCRRAPVAAQIGLFLVVACGIIWIFASLTFANPAPEFAGKEECPAGVPNWWPSF